MQRLVRISAAFFTMATLAGCGGGGGFLDDVFAGNDSEQTREYLEAEGLLPEEGRSTLVDLLTGGDDANVTVDVNRYLWNASLEILDFMPIEAADPFSGVIVFGYGTPPGGSRAYRATVYVQDPALEARSLRVAVQSRGGAVSRDTARQIEDAILTRARQLRLRDASL